MAENKGYQKEPVFSEDLQFFMAFSNTLYGAVPLLQYIVNLAPNCKFSGIGN